MRTPFAFITTLLLFSSALFADEYETLAETFSDAAKEFNVKTVAIIPFKHPEKPSSGAGLVTSEHLAAALVEHGKVKVVERTRMDAVLKEVEFQQSGLVDQKSAASVGKNLGAQAIISGIVSDINQSQARINAKMILVETSEVISANRVTVSKEWDRSNFSRAQHYREELAKYTAKWTKIYLRGYFGMAQPSSISWNNRVVYEGTTTSADDTGYIRNFDSIKMDTGTSFGAGFGTWFSKYVGLNSAFLLGTYRFADQTAKYSLEKKFDSIAGTGSLLDEATTIDSGERETVFDGNASYRFSGWALNTELRIRYPITPDTFPYIGIGMRTGIYKMKYDGSGDDAFHPDGHQPDLFGIIGLSVSAGFEYTIIERWLGLFVEYNYTDLVGSDDVGNTGFKSSATSFTTPEGDTLSSRTLHTKGTFGNIPVHTIYFGVSLNQTFKW